MEDMSPFQHWLCRRMDELHLSQTDLARQMDVARMTITNMASGKSLPESLMMIQKLATALQEDMVYVLDVTRRSQRKSR